MPGRNVITPLTATEIEWEATDGKTICTHGVWTPRVLFPGGAHCPCGPVKQNLMGQHWPTLHSKSALPPLRGGGVVGWRAKGRVILPDPGRSSWSHKTEAGLDGSASLGHLGIRGECVYPLWASTGMDSDSMPQKALSFARTICFPRHCGKTFFAFTFRPVLSRASFNRWLPNRDNLSKF